MTLKEHTDLASLSRPLSSIETLACQHQEQPPHKCACNTTIEIITGCTPNAPPSSSPLHSGAPDQRRKRFSVPGQDITIHTTANGGGNNGSIAAFLPSHPVTLPTTTTQLAIVPASFSYPPTPLISVRQRPGLGGREKIARYADASSAAAPGWAPASTLALFTRVSAAMSVVVVVVVIVVIVEKSEAGTRRKESARFYMTAIHCTIIHMHFNLPSFTALFVCLGMGSPRLTR